VLRRLARPAVEHRIQTADMSDTIQRYRGVTALRGWLRITPENGMVGAFVAVWILGVAIPLVGLLVASFLRTRGIHFVWQPTFDAYLSLIEYGNIDVLLRSLRIAATIAVIELLVAYPFALWLAKVVRSRRLKLMTFVALSVPFFLSPSARTFVWRIVLGSNGPINTALISLGIIDEPLDWLLFSEPAVHFGFLGPYFPSMVWPIYLSISLIDDDYLEASNDLGGSSWHTLRYVIFPLSIPGVVVGLIFASVPMLGDIVVPQLVGGGQVLMLSAEVQSLITVMNYSVAAALSAFILLFIIFFQIILWLVFRRAGGVGEVFASLQR
jgi:ABC-type spermidine/putrescine transport system permease subunit I